jgi:hypothetical protein
MTLILKGGLNSSTNSSNVTNPTTLPSLKDDFKAEYYIPIVILVVYSCVCFYWCCKGAEESSSSNYV